MLTLKQYQKTTLENFRLFLEEARFGNHSAAFEKHRTDSAKRAAPFALDVADFTQIRPQDIKDKAVILVGTIQTLR